ncbi:uncharacterized protein LOC118822957 isoform X2 [Colossoma macropomum]|uniref:uncharacterized protein LOC118822957 isoform X2 n=1 Tax=Colossoma macropomum TaxID=42526 RepID=UPI0018647290|nr:uncharacterized protein LOC118822957 isoform X2 [Colossoma macropomum]
MASSTAPLGPQNQNQKEHTGFLRHQEVNKISEKLRTKPHTAQSSKTGSENQDPNEATKPTKGVNKLKTVSRLPVLAKSLQPVLTEVSQTPGYKKWEERPLLGKAQKRKTCTKPVPFSLSQSRTHSQKIAEAASESEGSRMPLTHHSRQTPSKTLSTSQQRTKNRTPTHNTALRSAHVDHINNTKTKPLSLEGHTKSESQVVSDFSNEIGSSIQRDLSRQLGSITLAHSELTKDQTNSLRTAEVDDQAVRHPTTKGCIQTLLAASCTNTTGSAVAFSPDPSALRSILLNEGVKVSGPVGATPQASAHPLGRGTSIYSAQRVPVKKPQTKATTAEPEPTGSAVPFSPDPSALRSILQKEGVKVGGLSGATPRVSTCPSGRETSIFSAQRVPVKKPQTEVATVVPGRTGSAVPFSPDPSALRSILLNEGIKAGGPAGGTPRMSTCPSGRGTSIYSAQRVPIKKTRAEGPVTGAEHTGASRTPNTKWTQQRVPCGQSQSLRRLICAPKTPVFSASPGLSKTPAASTDSSTPQEVEEDVVQRLFQEEPEQEENEQMEEGRDTGPSLEHHQTVEPHLKHEGSTTTNSCLLQKENSIPVAQPFIQSTHRQSVIVLSSGLRLFGPGPTHGNAQTPEPAGQLQPCATSTEVQSTAPAQSARSSGSQSALNSDSKQVTPSALCKTKASGLSSAVCALRRRLPPLEEMFLDEECATYTSCQQAWPAQPRCSNPVASSLLFQDSTCFLPIGLNS